MSTDTSSTVAVNLRLPDELRRRIKVLAAKEDKSAQRWMVEALELVAAHEEKKNA